MHCDERRGELPDIYRGPQSLLEKRGLPGARLKEPGRVGVVISLSGRAASRKEGGRARPHTFWPLLQVT